MTLIEYRTAHGTAAWRTLADRAGTSYDYLMQLAHGHRKPSPDLVRRLLAASDNQLTREALRPDIYGPVWEAA